MIVKNGIVEGIEYLPSPNFDNRPDESSIDLIVIHAISLPPKKYDTQLIKDFFLNKLKPTKEPFLESIKDIKVSSHFLITRRGVLIQFVPIHKRAWHAGLSNYKGRKDCNDFSVGIELEGCDVDAFENSQYLKLIELTKIIMNEYNISIDNITGHSDIAPDRKTDPGELFDWKMYLSRL
ncbi:1,6-anhydro-N-acetylmuramyl-L-alanine amidase AmpD [Gammaproteobacteria bacterium]|jgi:AmpD protein|nr:1,6-anhydro-N-acetylmuramyl-L-alanine amidase AmpD [Gammaproteobacteria bacterium]|tara:strand:- start:552 stop:1088 length:537 start_codon:yes stop_codon:yes gene_type:complete